MGPCQNCQNPDTRGGRTFGFDERQKRPMWVCENCRRSSDPRFFKTAICRQEQGDRICTVSRGRGHIHTSQGPLYEEYIERSQA